MNSPRRRDKRRAIRVACTVPTQIRTRTGWMEVRALDLSRGGVRFSIPADRVGLAPGAALLEVARKLGTLLPERIECRLGAEGRVERVLRVVRIAAPDRKSSDITLGCLHDRPLEDEDALVLDVVLPREGESWDQAERRLEALKAQ